MASARAVLPESDPELLELAGIADLPEASEGLFRRDGWLRRVSSEQVLLFGGGRALLLEVAHPLVAAGVAQHSDFRRDPLGRLRRTLEAMSALTFADRERALAAARGVERAHARVRGTLPRAVGVFPAGTEYDGRAPELIRWVWATLVDTSLRVYEEFVAPLDVAAKEDYYAGQAAIARLLGVPPGRVPGSFAEFRADFDAALAGDELCVGPDAREIADSILQPPGGRGGGPVRLVTAGLLPERLREAFGLAWDPERARRFAALSASVRALRRERGL
jgi:uncharacterized protein (DUF2236 family)